MRKAAVVAGLLVMLSGCAGPAAPVAASSSKSVSPAPVTPTPTSAGSSTPAPKPRAGRRTTDAPPTFKSLEEVYLLENDIYSAGQVPTVACKLPNSALRTKNDVQRYSNAILACLERAWKPVVERSNMIFAPTRVYAVDENARTGCGTFGDAHDAFYCPGNTDIYADWREFVEQDSSDRPWAQVYLQFVMAHEFGHHVQQLVAIMQYYDDRWAASTGSAALEQSRRLELQASCFAAAFLGANQESLDLHGERLEDYRDAAYAGDEDDREAPRDHGSRKSATAWAKAAFTAKSPSACNTWAAPAKRVA